MNSDFKNNLIFTHHALQRFEERGLSFYEDLNWKSNWQKNQEHKDKNINLLKFLFLKSKESKSFINDSRFMVYLMDRYGDKNYSFYVLDNIVFLVIDKTMVVTILNNSRLPLINNKKYKKKIRVSEQEKMYERFQDHINLIEKSKSKEIVFFKEDRCFSNNEELEKILIDTFNFIEYKYVGKLSSTRHLYAILNTYFIISKNKKFEFIDDYKIKNPDFCLKSALSFFQYIPVTEDTYS